MIKKEIFDILLHGEISDWGNCCWGNWLLGKLVVGEIAVGEDVSGKL